MNELSYNVKPIILIADSSPHCLALYKEILKNENIIIYEANSIKEVMNSMKNKNPDLILLGSRLNGLNDNIKLNYLAEKNTPFILLSSIKSKEYKDEALKNGALYYFLKPVNIFILKEKIQKILNLQRIYKEFYNRDLELKPKYEVEKSYHYEG